MRVAMFSSKPYDHTFFEAVAGDHEIVFLEPHLTEKTAVLADGCQAVCCFVNDTLTANVLNDLKRRGISLIAMRCAGYNNVDLDTAKSLGVTVCRVPEYSPYAVAEHAVGLILTLNRNIHRAHNRVREGDYSLNGLMGFDMHGKTVGVIGAGKIGRAFIAIMLGFGCRVLVYDAYPPAELPIGVECVSLAQVLQQSHIISLHCPLTPDTYHMIDAQAVAGLRRGAMLINTSRGGLVDASAVIAGLKTGQIGYLGLDVYEEEGDIFFEDLSSQVVQDDVFARLTTFPNVIITGHQAFFTKEALQRIAEVTVGNLTAFSSGDHAGLQRVV